MTEREVKQLLKLLDKFRDNATPEEIPTPREKAAVNVIRMWVTWYGRDHLEMDL